MPRVTVHTKNKGGATRTCCKCVKPIEPGQRFYKWAFRYGGERRQHAACGRPRQSQLTQSNLSGAYAAIESVEDSCVAARAAKSLDGLAEDCRSAASDIEGVRDEYQSGYDNMPQGFQDGEPGSQSQEKIDALTELGEALENAASEIDDFESEMANAKAEDGEEGDAGPDGEAVDVNEEMETALQCGIEAAEQAAGSFSL